MPIKFNEDFTIAFGTQVKSFKKGEIATLLPEQEARCIQLCDSVIIKDDAPTKADARETKVDAPEETKKTKGKK